MMHLGTFYEEKKISNEILLKRNLISDPKFLNNKQKQKTSWSTTKSFLEWFSPIDFYTHPIYEQTF